MYVGFLAVDVPEVKPVLKKPTPAPQAKSTPAPLAKPTQGSGTSLLPSNASSKLVILLLVRISKPKFEVTKCKPTSDV